MNNSLLQNKYVQGLIVLVLVGIVGALTSYTYLNLLQAKGTYTGNTTISVNGEGEVLAKPDIGSFTFTVQTNGADAMAAQNEGTKIMDAIEAYLKENGVEEKDIKTDYYNLNPKYRYEDKPCPFGGYCQNDPIPDGFEVYQNVTVKVRKLDVAPTLIGGVGEKGATNISGLAFTIDDESVLKDQARAAAIEDAKMKAQELAGNLGMKLGKMVGYYENGGEPQPYYAMDGAMNEQATMDVKAAPVSLPMGENKITSSVSLSYELVR